jgi:hypothetical protein
MELLIILLVGLVSLVAECDPASYTYETDIYHD